MNAVQLNLLHPFERRSAAPIRMKFIMPVVAGFVMFFVLVWGCVVGVHLLIVNNRVSSLCAEVDMLAAKVSESEALKAKLINLQVEADQFAFYRHGRCERGELLKRLAMIMPEGITLTGLAIPPPPEQQLKRPFGSQLPPLQGPTQSVERVELRLTGLAQQEQDVFQLMQALEGASMTNLVRVVKNPAANEIESPRVLAFRQEAPTANGRRGVFFDIVYDLKPREFVK